MNDALGRRVPLLAAGALCTVAALLGATTDVFWWLLVVRCLFGIGMGINKCVARQPARAAARCRLGSLASAPRSASLAIYYAEITPKAERGVRAPHPPSEQSVNSLPLSVSRPRADALCLERRGWLR